MPSPKQIVLVTGLLGGAGAVWVPQLLAEDDGPPRNSENIPAMLGEPGDFEDGGAAAHSIRVDVSAAPAAPAASEDVQAPLPAPTDGGRPDGAATDSIGAAAAAGAGETPSSPSSDDLSSRASDLLASVSASLAAAEARRSHAPVAGPGHAPGDGFDPARLDPLEREAAAREWGTVQDFLEAAPVTAVMMGEGTAMALVGSRIVRPGDRLAGGLLEVRVIGREGVHYRYRDRDLIQELPVFQTSSAPRSDSESSPSAPESPEPAEPTTREAQ